MHKNLLHCWSFNLARESGLKVGVKTNLCIVVGSNTAHAKVDFNVSNETLVNKKFVFKAYNFNEKRDCITMVEQLLVVLKTYSSNSGHLPFIKQD